MNDLTFPGDRSVHFIEPAPWYLLRAATRQEERACDSLTELKIEHYMPCETVERKLCRRLVIVERALFPGYLFATIPDRDFHAATNAFGVHAAVRVTNGAGERVPRQVSPRLIEAIREAQARGDFDRTIIPPAKELETGDAVRVTSGPFEALVGAFVEARGKDRIAILLNSRLVEIDHAQIEAAA